MVQNARPVLTYLTSVQISNSEKEHSLHNSEDKFLFGMKLLKQQEKKKRPKDLNLSLPQSQNTLLRAPVPAVLIGIAEHGRGEGRL